MVDQSSRHEWLKKYLSRPAERFDDASNCIGEIPAEKRIKATSGQRTIWLHCELATPIPVYNEPVTLRYRGSLNVTVVQKALQQLLDRHESLRTGFEWVNDEVYQVIHTNVHVSSLFDDLREFPTQEREARARTLATADARALFDLASPPLLRARIVQLDEQEYRVYLVLVHIIADGVSLYKVLWPEFQLIYEALVRDEISGLDPLPFRFSQYVQWQQIQEATCLKARTVFWDQHLHGEIPLPRLPLDRERPQVREHLGGMQLFSLSEELSQQLLNVAQAESATVFVVLLAAFHVLLYQLTGEQRQLIAIVSDGRKLYGSDRLLGYLLNTLLLRTQALGHESFSKLVAHVRNTVLDALDNAIPYQDLLAHFREERKVRLDSFVQVMFSYQPDFPESAYGWQLDRMDVDVNAAKLDLYLEMEVRGNLIGRMIYARDIFDSETIAVFIQKWKYLLAQIATDPKSTVEKLANKISLITHSTALSSPSADRSLQAIVRRWLSRARSGLNRSS